MACGDYFVWVRERDVWGFLCVGECTMWGLLYVGE